MNKRISIMIIIALTGLVFAGCVGRDDTYKLTYEDGTFTGKTDEDERGSYGSIEIKIEDNKIVEADYEEIQKNGEAKDEDYKYQTSVEAMEVYEQELIKKQDPDEVEVVSGATSTWEKFKTAAHNATEKAEQERQ